MKQCKENPKKSSYIKNPLLFFYLFFKSSQSSSTNLIIFNGQKSKIRHGEKIADWTGFDYVQYGDKTANKRVDQMQNPPLIRMT